MSIPLRSSGPLFSVVIPTHNRVKLLQRAIGSVLAQTLPDFELLVVDSGDTDETRALVEGFRDGRISYLRMSGPGGVSAARNLGIRGSSGRYVSLLDDDDEYLPRFLEETRRIFERGEGLGFTWCGIQTVHDTPEGEKPVRKRLWRLRFDTPAEVRRSRLAASRIGAGFGLTVRRDCFETVGLFDESLLIEDTDFLLRLLSQGIRFDVVPEALVKIHRHPGPKLSRRVLDPEHMRAHEQLLDRYAGFLESNPEIEANLRDTLLLRHYWKGDRRLARRLLARRLRTGGLTFRSVRILLYFELIHPLIRLFRRPAPSSSRSTPRLIFTVTTGRSGTAYLWRILELVPGIASRHEPKPMFADVIREVQARPAAAREFWLERKLPAIAECGQPIYVETGHLFCKGFFEPLLELGETPDLILLSRPHRQVATSLLQLGTIPGRTEGGLRWYLSPEDPGVLPLADWRSLSDYQLCYWYCLEIERRARAYGETVRSRGGRVVAVTLAEINTIRGFRRLLRELDLPRPSLYNWAKYALNRNRIINRKPGERLAVEPPPDRDRQEREVLERVGLPRGTP